MNQIVWLARHGNRQDFVDPHWCETARFPFDPGLSPDGIVQAQRLGERLRGERITHLFASPFLRTVETAHYVAEALDLEIRLEPGLGEWINPEWFPAVPELRTLDALVEQFPRVVRDYRPLRTLSYPETWADVLARAGETARRLLQDYAGEVLLVGHAISVRGAVDGLVGTPAEVEYGLCSLSRLVRTERAWRAELCGDIAHLNESARLGFAA